MAPVKKGLPLKKGGFILQAACSDYFPRRGDKRLQSFKKKGAEEASVRPLLGGREVWLKLCLLLQVVGKAASQLIIP